jgi:signal transduction histidine kinase
MAERLQANDEQRRHLLAEVTHDLRTPLTIIQGNLEGILDGVYPRDDAQLGAILDETRLLSKLIDDLRLLALAEGGALPLRQEPADLAALIDEAAASFQPQAELGEVELVVETPPDLPELELDPVRIREVLTNLIANALRYTPPRGQVCIRCDREDGDRVVVSVSDTGPGIPAADLPHIFDRFYKSPDSPGAGLGLAIARNFVAAHGGEISASSEIGRGTTVRFTLPLR